MINLDGDSVLILLYLETFADADSAKSSLDVCLFRSVGGLRFALILCLLISDLVLVGFIFFPLAHSLCLLLVPVFSLLVSVEQQTMPEIFDYCKSTSFEMILLILFVLLLLS